MQFLSTTTGKAFLIDRKHKQKAELLLHWANTQWNTPLLWDQHFQARSRSLGSQGGEIHPHSTATLTGAAICITTGDEMMPPRLWLTSKASRLSRFWGFRQYGPRTAAGVPGSVVRGRIFLPEPRVPLGNPALPVICLSHLFPLVLRKSQNAGPDTGTEPAASTFLQGWTWTPATAR